MKKKLIALLMACVFVFALAGCGSTGTSPVNESETADLYSSPDNFKGRTFEFTAKVFATDKENRITYLRAWHDIDKYGQDTVIICPNTKETFNKDDYIKVEGIVDGVCSDNKGFGGALDAVQITAKSVKKIGVTDAFPAIKTVDVKKTIKKGSVKAMLKKVDWTNNETRLYMIIKNTGKNDVDVFPDQGKIVQKDKQKEAYYNFNYPNISSELKGRASTEGVVVFKKIDKKSFTYEFTGYDSSYNELKFKYKIKVR